jgi:hypothetical protein
MAASFAIRRWPSIEDGAQSLAIESETESVFLCKLCDLCFPIFLVPRPQPFQVLLVNRTVLPLAMHLVFDLSCEHFHRSVDRGKRRVRTYSLEKKGARTLALALPLMNKFSLLADPHPRQPTVFSVAASERSIMKRSRIRD